MFVETRLGPRTWVSTFHGQDLPPKNLWPLFGETRLAVVACDDGPAAMAVLFEDRTFRRRSFSLADVGTRHAGHAAYSSQGIRE